MDDGRCEFFFNDAATTEIYTLALHDALPIFRLLCASQSRWSRAVRPGWAALLSSSAPTVRIGSASSAYARPAIRAVPAVGRSRPTSTRMVVGLPAPVRPRKAVTLPGATSKVRPSPALTVPCRLVSPQASITGHLLRSSCPDPRRRAGAPPPPRPDPGVQRLTGAPRPVPLGDPAAPTPRPPPTSAVPRPPAPRGPPRLPRRPRVSPSPAGRRAARRTAGSGRAQAAGPGD